MLPRGHRTLGEALIAAIGLIGFLAYGYWDRLTTMGDIWMYALMLGIIVVFYFLLLLVRAIHTFMVGGENFWWEKYEDDWKHHQVAKKRTSKE